MVFEDIALSVSGNELLKVGLLILIGILLGILVKFFVKKIGASMIYPWVRKSSPGSYKRTRSWVNLTASIFQWIVVILFFIQALSVFEIYLLDEIIRLTINFVPRLGVAFLILVIGLVLSSIFVRKVNDLDFKGNKIIAKFLEIILIFAIILSALEAINVKVTAFQDIFRAGVYGVMIAGALVIGIAFGLALKPEVEKWIAGLKKKK